MVREERLTIRAATADDAEAIAEVWYRGWRDGHLGLVPEELVRVRTEASFYPRAAERVGDTTVAVVDGAVAGFVTVVDDEAEQVFVAAGHRGTGIAGRLLAEAEARVRANGHRRAWLAVVAGNARARAFYEREGWHDAGPFDYSAEGPDGPIAVPCRRYVKSL